MQQITRSKLKLERRTTLSPDPSPERQERGAKQVWLEHGSLSRVRAL